MKRKKRAVGKKNAIAPRMSWQTGEYSRQVHFDFLLPYEFLLIAKLLRTTPRELLKNFMQQLTGSCITHSNHGAGRQKLIEFIVLLPSVQNRMQGEQVITMFRELEPLFIPGLDEAEETLLDQYETWKDKYLEHWFDKWNDRLRCVKYE